MRRPRSAVVVVKRRQHTRTYAIDYPSTAMRELVPPQGLSPNRPARLHACRSSRPGECPRILQRSREVPVSVRRPMARAVGGRTGLLAPAFSPGDRGQPGRGGDRTYESSPRGTAASMGGRHRSCVRTPVRSMRMSATRSTETGWFGAGKFFHGAANGVRERTPRPARLNGLSGCTTRGWFDSWSSIDR
jgi:hypothetical protein